MLYITLVVLTLVLLEFRAPKYAKWERHLEDVEAYNQAYHYGKLQIKQVQVVKKPKKKKKKTVFRMNPTTDVNGLLGVRVFYKQGFFGKTRSQVFGDESLAQEFIKKVG